VSAAAQESDIYESDLAGRQFAYDMQPCRQSLYTNTKADHPAGCACEQGEWSHGFSPGAALRAEYDPCGPGAPSPGLEAGQ
jgi:hypothetical protein